MRMAFRIGTFCKVHACGERCKNVESKQAGLCLDILGRDIWFASRRSCRRRSSTPKRADAPHPESDRVQYTDVLLCKQQPHTPAFPLRLPHTHPELPPSSQQTLGEGTSALRVDPLPAAGNVSGGERESRPRLCTTSAERWRS